MNPNTAVRSVLVSAVAWAASRQKLRELTQKYEDLQDRKSTTKDDLVKLRKELDKAKQEIVSTAEKHEKAVIEFNKVHAALSKTPILSRRRKSIDLKGIAKGVGMVASAFEQALDPAKKPIAWQPPENVIDVQVIDATPKKP